MPRKSIPAQSEGSILYHQRHEVILHLIGRIRKTRIEEAIQEALLQVTGAFSLIFLTPEKMIRSETLRFSAHLFWISRWVSRGQV